MAKFQGKNIEFLDSQKAIFGDNDDSSIYWNGNNNELTITTVVSGVTPTEPGHLTPRWYIDDRLTTISGGIIQDHGALVGLDDDDHPQYHDDLRGDARYYTQGQIDTISGSLQTEIDNKSDDTHTHLETDITNLDKYTQAEVDSLVTSTSGSIIKDHGNLEGLGDDDHPQYVPIDGSRGFTSTVSGVSPTEDYHLTTRKFLLDVLLGTTESGVEIPQVGNILFGSEFHYNTSNSVSSTNSTTYQHKVSVTTNSGTPEGAYRLGTHIDWRISKNNVDFYYRILEDGATVLDEYIQPTLNDVNIYNSVTNFYYLPTLSSGTHTFAIEYHSESSGSTAYIKNARIEFWRVA